MVSTTSTHSPAGLTNEPLNQPPVLASQRQGFRLSPHWPIAVFSRTPVILAAALVLVEVLSWKFSWFLFVESVPMSAVVFLVPVVLVAVSKKPPREFLAPAVMLTATVVLSLLTSVGLVTAAGLTTDPSSSAGLLPAALLVAGFCLSALTETVVFFLAVPVLLLFFLSHAVNLGKFLFATSKSSQSPTQCQMSTVSCNLVFAVSLFVSCLVFAFLPGHQAQFSNTDPVSLLGPLPWLAAAGLWFWLLFRRVPIFSVGLFHASTNAAAFCVFPWSGLGSPVPFLFYSSAVLIPVVVFIATLFMSSRRLAVLPVSTQASCV